MMLTRRSPWVLNRLPRRCFNPKSRLRLQSSKATQTAKREEPGARVQSRLDRTINRLPRFLQRYIVPVRHAPVSHITSFLILHEVTAVVPLLGLWATFHYTNWLPPYFSEGKWVHEGMEKFGRYFRKKRWFGFGKAKTGPGEGEDLEAMKREVGKRELWWNRGQGGVRILVEVATAWAVTKALLPFRIILSVWGTPWFARTVLKPASNGFWNLFRKKG